MTLSNKSIFFLILLSIFCFSILFFFDRFTLLLLNLSPDRSFSPLTILRLKLFFLSLGIAGLILLLFFSVLKTSFKKVVGRLVNLKHFLLLFLAIAFILRLSCVFFLDWGTFPDFEWYENRAYILSSGGGYEEEGYPTARFPPGYPFFLASIYKIFGHNICFAKIANVFLSVLICFFSYKIAKRKEFNYIPKITVIILSFFPSQIFFTSLLASEILFSFLFLTVFYLLIIQIKENKGFFLPIFIGLFLGLATLTRGVTLFFPLVIFFFFFSLKKKGFIKKIFIILFSMFLILFPWMFRNKQKLGYFTLSTNIGVNLWKGNNPQSAGNGICPDKSEFKNIPPDPKIQVETDRLCFNLAIDFIKNNHFKFLKLGIRKQINLFATDMFPLENKLKNLGEKLKWNKYIILAVFSQTYYILIFFLFISGVFLYFKKNIRGIFSLLLYTVVYWMAIHFLFFGMDRFHFPIVPILSIFSGFVLNYYFFEEKKDAFNY